MKEIIPFEKIINFPTKISSITSISLDHKETIEQGEINGEFSVYGEYKAHPDTTEIENFNYKLPFTTMIPEDIIENTVKVDVSDFTYDCVDNDKLKVIIEYRIEGEQIERLEEQEDEELDRILNNVDEPIIEEKIDLDREQSEEIIETKVEEVEENYVLYHIHIVEKEETLEKILKKYEISLDDLKEYNDINKIDIGTKLIIPYHE